MAKNKVGVRKWCLMDTIMTYLPIEPLMNLVTGKKKKNRK